MVTAGFLMLVFFSFFDESDKIFVLVLFFILHTNIDFLTNYLGATNRRHCGLELRYFTYLFFVTLWGIKDIQFCPFSTIKDIYFSINISKIVTN